MLYSIDLITFISRIFFINYLGLASKRSEERVRKQMTQCSDLNQHMSDLLRIRDGNMDILTKFGNLSLSRIITRV
jgi:hypothetical protein